MIKKIVIFGIVVTFAPFLFAQEGIKHEAKSFKVEGFTKTGDKQWEIEGASAEMIEDEVMFSKIKAIGYHENISVTLTADRGAYNKKTGEVELEGNVEATTSDGGSLVTDKAMWNARGEEVTTDSFVKVTKDGIVSEGKGGTAKPKSKIASLKAEIKVTIPPATVITCDGPFDIFYDEKRAVFNNNVLVQDKDGEMRADEVTAFFDPDSRQINRVLAKGSVRITRYKTAQGDFINAPIGN